MTTCDYCGEDFTVIFTCRECRGKFCSKHRLPVNHECSSIRETVAIEENTGIPDAGSEPSREQMPSDIGIPIEEPLIVEPIEDMLAIKTETDAAQQIEYEKPVETAVDPEAVDINVDASLIDNTPADSMSTVMDDDHLETEKDAPTEPESSEAVVIDVEPQEDKDSEPQNGLLIKEDDAGEARSEEETHDLVDMDNPMGDEMPAELSGAPSEEQQDTVPVEELPAKMDVPPKKSGGFFSLNLVLVTLLVVSLVINGFLYFEYQDYKVLYGNYVELYNNTDLLQSYYGDLTDQYSELRQEYTQLDTYYSDLLLSKSQLEKEYEDILNYRKEIQLVSEKTITILPKQNYTEIFEIPFSGYITVNYTATGEVYTWVGSTGIDNGFYSRNPQFPNTASTYIFTVPVQPDLIVYFANPDEFNSVKITYWISFTY